MAGEQSPEPHRKDVDRFVRRLETFYDSLDEIDRDMLEAILESSQGGPFRYVRRSGRYAGNEEGWNELARWLTEGDELLGWFTSTEGGDGLYYRRRT